MKIHGLIVAVVVALLMGASFLPVAHSTMNHDGLVVSVSIAGEREIKKSVSIESVKSLSCMLAELHNHPDAFDVHFPALLQELEADGLIEDTHRIEELIVNAVKKPGLVPSGNLFLNVCCFMMGHSTNSGVLRLSELYYPWFAQNSILAHNLHTYTEQYHPVPFNGAGLFHALFASAAPPGRRMGYWLGRDNLHIRADGASYCRDTWWKIR